MGAGSHETDTARLHNERLLAGANIFGGAAALPPELPSGRVSDALLLLLSGEGETEDCGLKLPGLEEMTTAVGMEADALLAGVATAAAPIGNLVSATPPSLAAQATTNKRAREATTHAHLEQQAQDSGLVAAAGVAATAVMGVRNSSDDGGASSASGLGGTLLARLAAGDQPAAAPGTSGTSWARSAHKRPCLDLSDAGLAALNQQRHALMAGTAALQQ